MALQIVECPRCKSTFNTSAASLESADGKFRCGACLSVFEPKKNLVESDVDLSNIEKESVFLSNNLRNYPSASSFLTKEALENQEILEEQKDIKSADVKNTLNINYSNQIHRQVKTQKNLKDSIGNTLGNIGDRILRDKNFLGKRSIYLLFFSIIIFSGLITQYFWYNRSLYSQDDRIRPFLEYVCGYFNCNLPIYSNISSIKSESSSVRSHPTIENSLIVSIQIINTSPYPQAFPALILSFNSINNKLLSNREYFSVEYLDSTFYKAALMPVMTPIQISIEIRDPGPEATNYSLALRRP